MTSPRIRRVVACGLLVSQCVALQGCGPGWRIVGPPTPATFPERQQVQVWHGGRAEQWHAVVLGADSISGIPFHRPISCDSCRVGLARVAVDSLRVGNPVAGFWKGVGLVMGATLVLCALVCPREMS